MKDNKHIFNQKVIQLRKEIDGIDSQILTLLAKRQAQVEKVVQLKKKHQIPVYHPAREEDLISRLRMQAEKINLDPDFMEDLYRVIIRQSRVKQTDQMQQKGIKQNAKVLIVGGKGQMGIFFASLFYKSGYETRTLDKDDWHKAQTLCKNIDLCLISVPIEKTENIIKQIAPFLDNKTILADLTSTKSGPLKKMLESHSGPVAGLHPLFGPTTGSLDKQIIVVTPGRDPDQYLWLKEQFSIWGAVIVESGAEAHDDIMDMVQALRHFATFSFGYFLCSNHVDLEKSLEFSSPIYRLELGMVGRLFAQDSGLYSEIIFATKKRRDLLRKYIHSLNDHLDMLDSNNKHGFIEKFNHISSWFGPFSEQAMRESTFLINKLIERF